jgi:quercetin dioxygenase-like cupin family protein
MGYKINRLVKGLKDTAFIGFDNHKRIVVEHIPYEWTPFSDKGDYWKRLMLSSDADVDCVEYFAPAGLEFGLHIHENDELWHCFGEVTIKTPDSIQTYTSGSVVFIPKETLHRATFHTDTTVILTWYPSFKNAGWVADFIDENEN